MDALGFETPTPEERVLVMFFVKWAGPFPVWAHVAIAFAAPGGADVYDLVTGSTP